MLPPGVRRGYPQKSCLPLRFPVGRAGGVEKGAAGVVAVVPPEARSQQNHRE